MWQFRERDNLHPTFIDFEKELVKQRIKAERAEKETDGVKRLERESNLKTMLLEINVLIRGFNVTVMADLNGTDCPVTEVHIMGMDEIAVYGPEGYYGLFPYDTEFRLKLG